MARTGTKMNGRPLLGYAPKGAEFAVEDALNDIGAFCVVPRKVELVRLPKQRRPSVIESPYWQNYIFARMTDEQWHFARTALWVPSQDGGKVRVNFSTVMWIDEREWERWVMPAVARIEQDYQVRMAQIEAGERLSEYSAGDALQLLGEPLGARMGIFRRVIEGKLPMIEAELQGVTLLGKPVVVKVDPVMARRAAE